MTAEEWSTLRGTVLDVQRAARRVATCLTAVSMACGGVLMALTQLPLTATAVVAAGASATASYCGRAITLRRGNSRALRDLNQHVVSVLAFDPADEDIARLVRNLGTIAGQYKLVARSEDGITTVWAQDLDTAAYRRHWSWITGGGS